MAWRGRDITFVKSSATEVSLLLLHRQTGILLAFANQCIIYGRQFDTPKPTGVFNNSLRLSPAQNWSFRDKTSEPLQKDLEAVPAATQELSPLPEGLLSARQGAAGFLQHTLCWKCTLTHRQTQHSLRENQKCLLGGWKMSTILPVNVGGQLCWIQWSGSLKTSCDCSGEQKSAFDPTGNNFSRSSTSLNVVCKPNLGLSVRLAEELDGCWKAGSLWEFSLDLMGSACFSSGINVASPGIRMCTGHQKQRTTECDFCTIPKEFINWVREGISGISVEASEANMGH